MEKHSLCFLENDFKELSSLAKELEETLYTDSHSTIVKGRLFAEKLLERFCEDEGQEYLKSFKQVDRIRILNKEGAINDDIARSFDTIRIIGNKAIHTGENNDIEYAIKIHKQIYIIAKWYVEIYGRNCDLEIPKYRLPELPTHKEVINLNDIDDIVKKRLEETLRNLDKKSIVEEKGIERDLNRSNEEIETDEIAMKILGYEYTDEIMADVEEIIEEEIKVADGNNNEGIDLYKYKKLKESYLLNEISKLSDSSQEAVESAEVLDIFKNYLHVERTIQDEFINNLKEANKSETAQIVFLCGSVGDGKSHLLAYASQNYSEIIKNFDIHNDATESFDPNMTEIETLEKVLRDFSDENIEASKSKLVLAINLGVLHNFLEEDFAKRNYTKLQKFIKDSNIFNQQTISKSYSYENFKLVSFGDYSIYELTKEGPKSKYIENLLNKIVSKDEKNPFYNAYLKDKENGFYSPVIENFEILSMTGVITQISNIVISAMVKYKRIIGTRELLNFIYELLVPANIDEFDMTSSDIECARALLPNILFSSSERGPLLKLISKEDPIRIRDEKLDSILIKLNITSDLNEILDEYIDGERIDKLYSILADIKNLTLISNDFKQELIDIIIRSLYLIGNSDIKYIFIDESYKKFMKYLYYFNSGDIKGYKDMFKEVEDAIFNWNGYLRAGYIYLNEDLKRFKFAKRLELKKSKIGTMDKNIKDEIERFKNNITISFEGLNNKYESIEIDYQLYKKIVSVNNGYCLSKTDKEESVRFIEFIDKIISHGTKNDEILIEEKDDRSLFSLNYEEDFEEFSFERMEM